MASIATVSPTHWWQKAVVYQIYPSSFKDSDGDGLGDVPGIISKVDYLASLGIDAVWLSPCYKSPQVDMGYDISDYRTIHKPYGTVEDVEVLISQLRQRGMKLLMDLVVNHTSDQHPWFLESRSSPHNPKRDWYHWRKGRIGPGGDKLPPNNWESLFRGSAWDYDQATDEYYFHTFAAAQPDLNWDNPEVRAAIHEDIHFWLQKGLGGLRMDAINLISKPLDFPDSPITQPGLYQPCFSLIKNRPSVHEWLRELKENVLDQYQDLVTIGECGGTDAVDDILLFVDPKRNELDVIFQFELTEIDKGPNGVFSRKDWTLGEVKRITEKWQNVLRPAWNTFHLENHDGGRSVNRYGRTSDPKYFPAVSKMLAFFVMTLGGTIFLHQGQEIGSRNLTEDVPLSEYKDMATHSEWENIRSSRVRKVDGREEEVDMSDVMREVLLKARDHGRVPIAWDNSEGAGFTTGKPWMSLGSTYKENNAKEQEEDEGSVLNTWRKMIAFRKKHTEILVYGTFQLVDPDHEQVFAYTQTAKDGKKILLAMNWSPEKVLWKVPTGVEKEKIMSIGVSQEKGEELEMDPYTYIAWEA